MMAILKQGGNGTPRNLAVRWLTSGMLRVLGSNLICRRSDLQQPLTQPQQQQHQQQQQVPSREDPFCTEHSEHTVPARTAPVAAGLSHTAAAASIICEAGVDADRQLTVLLSSHRHLQLT
jgi:hypothetical protein